VNGAEWDTTPTLDALLAEGTELEHVVAPRGLSGPALASLLTGTYPRTHGVRENGRSVNDEGIEDGVATLGERFAAAGYTTYGFSGNQCYLLDDEMETVCTWADPQTTQEEGDTELTDALVGTLLGADPAEPIYAWLHFIDPHDPYAAREPWFSAFHPEPYDGPYADDIDAAVAAWQAGDGDYTEADRRYVEAVYASQIAATDAHIAEVLDALRATGRAEDALIGFAIDHGEALGRRNTYFNHGCSPYQEVLGLTFGLWGPGRVPAGYVQHGRVPSVDFAPTVAELAGVAWERTEGESLASDLRACNDVSRPAFFERGTSAAGVVDGGLSYLLDPTAGFANCIGYDDLHPYRNGAEELHDLDADPLELTDLSADRPEDAARLREAVCAWVNDGPWNGGRTPRRW
jgi:arylsulfatase A-like enzyme